MIPTQVGNEIGWGLNTEFQSRNRETYDSNKKEDNPHLLAGEQFQSRNRETYDSNHIS